MTKKILQVLMLAVIAASACSAAETGPAAADEERYIKVVREFADNVLEHGRDKYGPKHTPLFVDGIDVNTREPVKWVNGGQTWIMSNLANQQNLFRTLVGLTNLTGEPKYRQGAVDATKYAFEHLRGPNGLLFWGGHCLYDAGTEKVVGEIFTDPYGKPDGLCKHELKSHYPYWELMWEVDPKATKEIIETMWNGHVLNWQNLDFDRHTPYSKTMGALWKNEYKGDKAFYTWGHTFMSTGSDLFLAAGLLHKFTGEEPPLVWAKRLAYRYAESRWSSGLGDTSFGHFTRDKTKSGQAIPSKPAAKPAAKPETEEPEDKPPAAPPAEPPAKPPATPANPLLRVNTHSRYTMVGTCQLKLAETLGEAGNDFLKWAHEDLTAHARYCSELLADDFKPKVKELSKKALSCYNVSTHPRFFWTYSLAWRLTGDKLMWDTARKLALAKGLGDIGETPEGPAKLEMNTNASHPSLLFGLLELHRKTKNKDYLELSKRIGDNIIQEQFQKGFFMCGRTPTLARFDSISALALVHLAAAIKGKPELAPVFFGGRPYFHCVFDGKGRTYDNSVFWGWDP